MKFKEFIFKDKSLKYESITIVSLLILFFIINLFIEKGNFIQQLTILVSSLIILVIFYLLIFIAKYGLLFFILKIGKRTLFKISFIVLEFFKWNILIYSFFSTPFGTELKFLNFLNFNILLLQLLSLILGVSLGLIYSKRLIKQ